MEFSLNKNQNSENKNNESNGEMRRPGSRSRVVYRDSNRSRSRSRSLIKKLKKQREELKKERNELEQIKLQQENQGSKFEAEKTSENEKSDPDVLKRDKFKQSPFFNLFKGYGKKFNGDENFRKMVMYQSNEYPLVDRKCAYVLILFNIVCPGLGTILMSLMSNRAFLWFFIGILQMIILILLGIIFTNFNKCFSIFAWIWPLLTMFNMIKFNRKERARMRFNLSLDK